RVWSESHISSEISDRQREGLVEIGETLHRKLCCWLAKTLGQMGIGQMIVIPDGLTRHLPLHLSRVCGKEIHIKIPGIPTDNATILGEVFPVEYAPCLQAVAISQHQKRPRAVTAVLSVSDPKSNLPGARNTSDLLGSRVPATVKYNSYLREQATLSNLSRSIDEADIVFIGAHGIFKPASPVDSYLEFHDGHWTMAEMLDRPAFARSPIIILSACEVGASAPGDEMAASGIPGALISAGAACVLGGLWPLEDISTGYVVEKFLDHLSHRGFRPAAALFRALRDLRQLPKDKVIERCQNLLDKMDEDGTADSLVEQYLRLNELKERIEDSDAEYPFASPQFWGGIVIVGSGWASPAGAAVAASPTSIIDAVLKRREAQDLVSKGQYKEARAILNETLAFVDGAERGRVLNALAFTLWESRRKGADKAARREAMQLLAEAEDLAKADQDEQLLRNINATMQKIDL
ncbi:MAG TPA: CHAT domain-containing protein, partial [Blastocatellia bacterium]|nr:CHAT domain-containing protein [Blastocatellia bacterium]